jgi:hypothetical protein
MAVFTTLERLQSVITERRTVQFFDDDGDGVIAESDAGVQFAMNSANDKATSIIFRKGFSLEQLDLLAADESLQRYATVLFAMYAGQRRLEFLDQEGRGPYDAMGKQALLDLQAISTGELRSKIEATAGANPLTDADTNTGDPLFVVSRDPRYPGTPGPGGF